MNRVDGVDSDKNVSVSIDRVPESFEVGTEKDVPVHHPPVAERAAGDKEFSKKRHSESAGTGRADQAGTFDARDFSSKEHEVSHGDARGDDRAHSTEATTGRSATVSDSQSAKHEKTAVDSMSKESDNLRVVQGGYLDELAVTDIFPNSQQPRTIFDEEDLQELADSIRQVGVLQPVVVREISKGAAHNDNKDASLDKEDTPSHVSRETSHRYELIMGERRWRASQLAGLDTIPAIVKTTADDYMLRDALLENLHRVELNPLEEAAAFQQMMDDFGLTQAELSESVSLSRPQISNTLRLLKLPPSIQKQVASGVLSAGHARALLSLPSVEAMEKLAGRIIAEGLSVRSTEEIVAVQSGVATTKQPLKRANSWEESLQRQRLENRLDTKVTITGSAKHGKIHIVFSSPEDMERILNLLDPTENDKDDGARRESQNWI